MPDQRWPEVVIGNDDPPLDRQREQPTDKTPLQFQELKEGATHVVPTTKEIEGLKKILAIVR